MTDRRRVCVVGAGLAGMTAALAAAEAGARVTVFERDARPHGATRDSAGWIWRYATLADARRNAPDGDPSVQRALVEQLDDVLRWLVLQGAELLATTTGREQTRGVRIDPPQACDALLSRMRAHPDIELRTGAAVSDVRLEHGAGIHLDVADAEPASCDAVVLAGGGYARDRARVARESGAPADACAAWVLRARHGGDGSTTSIGERLGAARPRHDGECLVRIVVTLPDATEHDPELLVQLSELQLPDARLLDASGRVLVRGADDWSGAQQAWRLARTTGHGRLVVPAAAADRMLHCGLRVHEVVERAARSGARIEHRPDGGWDVPVRAGITHTRCGMRVDARGALLDVRGEPIPGCFAAGVDARDAGAGGSGSGLAQALVLGRAAGAAAATI